MGISIDILPSFGLGFALHFEFAVFELFIGPFLILIGDIDSVEDN